MVGIEYTLFEQISEGDRPKRLTTKSGGPAAALQEKL